MTKNKIIKLYQDFGQMTTMHGVKRASASSTTWLRVLWSVSVLAGMGWATYQVAQAIQNYYSYPVATQLSFDYNDTLELPAVTLCNLNKVRLSRADQNLRSSMDSWAKKNMPLQQQMDELSLLLNTYSREKKAALGHSINDMLLKCAFNSMPCFSVNFTQDTDINNGNCFTFGDRISRPSAQWLVTKPGPFNGLILELDIEQDEYLPITESAGIKVLLHSGSEIVFPDDSGTLAAPGFVTSISVRKSETHTLPEPYGYCVSQASNDYQYMNIYTSLGYTYTKSSCMRTCLQERIYRTCNCIDVDVIDVLKVLKYGSSNDVPIPKCNQGNASCVIHMEKQFQINQLGCKELCPAACDQTSYHSTVTIGVWPAENYMDNYIRAINQSGRLKSKTAWTNNPGVYVRKNCIRLAVFYETLRYEIFSTSPQLNWNSLVGNIGGQLGLWLGFSVLTAIEVVQFTIHVCFYLFRRLFSKSIQRGSRNEHSRNEDSQNEHSRNENSRYEHSRNEHSGNEHSRNEYSRNKHSRNEHSRIEHSRNEHSGNENSRNEHSRNKYSRNEQSRNEHSRNEHSGNEHSRNEHSRNKHSRNERSRNEHSRNEPSRYEDSRYEHCQYEHSQYEQPV